ncbi:hypothetical protein BKA61DRAFT_678456 [Leptodontidium sp. MPI-SDFR-AT-0119]|nr:hypothetical protein BKA61DRAFT_678456 [Leptodontidium sp. MPI-SDFR-AT-0119]
MGSYEVSLFDVCIASEWMTKKRGYVSSTRSALAVSLAYMLYGFKDGGPLLVMLAGMSHMEAIDPRDKIYAPLGLYSSWASLCGKAKPSFKPDYKKMTSEVYGDFVRYFLTLERGHDDDEGSLRIMLRNERFVSQGELAVETEYDEVDSDFPSWVSRWDQCRPPWLGFSTWRLAIKLCPSGESPISISDTTDSTVLSLKGFAISTIGFLNGSPSYLLLGLNPTMRLFRPLLTRF